MSNFYSSVTIHEGLVIFNANDYHLYVYNKKDGSLKWSVETNYKSTIPVFVQDSIIYAAISKKEIHQAAQFDLANGDLIKALPFGPLATKPLIKNGMLYGTAIYNFGCILAYDLEKDTVVWIILGGRGRGGGGGGGGPRGGASTLAYRGLEIKGKLADDILEQIF
ncbi:MAG: PQQ-binding-like beta-propeller repeat protein [Chitinophagaceae bacterium]|nr:PQQ-binding-like beta-propeller repeat protein [Chitinophagaceae bacterium]